MSFLRTSISVIATQVAVAPVALLTGVVLARGLPVAERGFYAAAVEFVALLVVAIELGWATTAIYRVRKVEIPAGRVAAAALIVTGLISALAVVAGVIWQDAIRARFLAGSDPRLLQVALIAIPFELAGVIFTGVARGLGHFDLHNAYHLGTTLLLLVGASVAVLWDAHAVVAMVGLLSAHAVAGSVVVIGVLRRSGFELGHPLREIRESLGFGLLSHVQKILMALHQRIDILLLAWLAGDPEAVAVYAVAVGVVDRVRLLPMSIALAMYPTIAGQSQDEASRFAARVTRLSVLLVWVTALGLGLVATWLVPLLFGAEYARSVAPLLALLPAAVFLTPGMILARYFTARARQPTVIAILSVATAVNVSLNLQWIPRYGVLGAGAASGVSYGLQLLFIVLAFRRESGRTLREALLVTAEDVRVYWARLAAWWSRRATG